MRHCHLLTLAVVGGLAALASSEVAVTPALAQQAWSDLDIAAHGHAPLPPARPRLQTIVDEDEAAPPPPMPGDTADATQPGEAKRTVASTAKGLRQAIIPERTQVERGQADGQTEPPPSTDLPIDGHIVVAEPPAVADGIEPFGSDPRLTTDRAAFQAPPAGYDALAFQIELDPSNDARTTRLARFEPFEPVGHRAGSWVFYPTVETGVSSVSNVFASPQAQSDFVFDVRPTLLAVTDWQRHALQFKATALQSQYGSYAGADDRAYAFEARGRLDITRMANVEVLVSHSLDQEAATSFFATGNASRRVPYTTDKAAAAYNQRFGDWSLQVRGTITGVDYSSVPANDGSIIDNTSRDFITRDLAVRTAWHFSPMLALFSESAINGQTYAALPSDGIGRNSVGDRYRLGLSFGNDQQIWRGEIAVGYGHQHAMDTRISDAAGLLIDANLAWRPTQITSVLAKASTEFVTSTLPGEGNAVQRTAGLELRHAFSRRINGIAGVSATETEFEGIPLTERLTSVNIGVEYYLNRQTTVLASLKHDITSSNTPGTEATIDTVRMGLRWSP